MNGAVVRCTERNLLISALSNVHNTGIILSLVEVVHTRKCKNKRRSVSLSGPLAQIAGIICGPCVHDFQRVVVTFRHPCRRYGDVIVRIHRHNVKGPF